jgi:hypothetical protein
VLPAGTELDHADAYPDALVHRLRDQGPGFGETRPGLTVPGRTRGHSS